MFLFVDKKRFLDRKWIFFNFNNRSIIIFRIILFKFNILDEKSHEHEVTVPYCGFYHAFMPSNYLN